MNSLSTGLPKRAWKVSEIEFIFAAQAKHGNSWALIASKLQGRTENQVKNRFYATIRKNVRRFNKGKPFTETIIFLNPRLLENKEIKNIITMVDASREELADMKLSDQALCAINSQILGKKTRVGLDAAIRNCYTDFIGGMPSRPSKASY